MSILYVLLFITSLAVTRKHKQGNKKLKISIFSIIIIINYYCETQQQQQQKRKRIKTIKMD